MNAQRCYLAGRMRGVERFNFDAFDDAAAWLRSHGWEVVSPAEIDRELGLDESLAPELPPWFTMARAMQRDLNEITDERCSAIVLLPHWENSEGTCKEITVGMWTGRDLYELVDEPPANVDRLPRRRLRPLQYDHARERMAG